MSGRSRSDGTHAACVVGWVLTLTLMLGASTPALAAPPTSPNTTDEGGSPAVVDPRAPPAATKTPTAAPGDPAETPLPEPNADPDAADAADGPTVDRERAASPSLRIAIAAKPPPLNVEYVQYGVALTTEALLSAGATCPEGVTAKPCIIGAGGGPTVRGGYRSPGPWYVGGAYEFIKMDSSNLLRLGIFQQVRFELRYAPTTGYRASPYFTWGIGAVGYGSEWGIETGGALGFGGVGLELEVSRVAVLGVALVYKPVLLAGWTDSANQVRETGLAQFLSFDITLELRTEIGRR